MHRTLMNGIRRPSIAADSLGLGDGGEELAKAGVARALQQNTPTDRSRGLSQVEAAGS